MLEQLISLDKSFFVAINTGLANPFFDLICPWFRRQEIWYPAYLIVLALIIKVFKKDSWKLILAIALLVFSCDQFSAHLVKPLFQRLRPCNEPSLAGMVRHLIESCNGYSFISAHATNHFGVAVFLIVVFRKYLHAVAITAILFWAAFIAFSQVYVGVHYPLDVITGAIVGSLFGLSYSRYSLKYVKEKVA